MSSSTRMTAAACAIAAVTTVWTLAAAPAAAAGVPTISVTAAGHTDWQVTFYHGRTTASDCTVLVDNRAALTTPERTATLRGTDVRPGMHTVRVRCAHRSSPTITLFAPRGQINDIGTWLSNSTAGIIGY